MAAIAVFPAVSSNEYFLTILAFVGIHVLICTGLNLLMGYAGQLCLGHAGFWGCGAYISGVLTAKFAWPPVLALFPSIFGTALVAFIVGFPILQLRGHYLSMATLGFGIVVYILFVQVDSLTGGPSGLVNVPSFSVAGFSVDTPLRNYYFIWGVTAVGLVGAMNLANSRVGRALKAIHTSEVAAETMGIKTFRYKLMIFVLSAVYAAVGGVLYVHYLNFVAPATFGFMASMLLVTMVAAGGIGTLWGPILGAMILTVLPEYLRAYEGLEVLLYGVILAAVMMFMPRGLASVLGGIPSYVQHLVRMK